MKKTILSGILAVLSISAAFADTTSFDAQVSAAATASAKNSGAQAAGALTGKLPKVDNNGQTVLDAKGAPIMESASNEGVQGSLRMFQDITGLQSAATVSSPAQASKEGLANISVKHSFQFSCAAKSNAGPFSTGPLAFMVDSCQTATGSKAVNAVSFKVCENASSAGTCDVAADFSSAVTVSSGQFAPYGTASLGLGCNNAGTCILSMTGTYSIGGSDTTMKASAPTLAAKSNVLSNLRENVVGADYAKTVVEVGTPLAACARENRTATATGTVITCNTDNPQTIKLTATQNSAQCTGVKTCLQEATSVSKFTRTCNRSFPLTEQISKLSYPNNSTCIVTQISTPKKQTCNIVTYADPKITSTSSCRPDASTDLTTGLTLISKSTEACSSKDSTSGSCASTSWTELWVQTINVPVITTNSCKPDDSTNQTTGMTKVGQTQEQCNAITEGAGTCENKSWTEFWAQITNPVVLAKTASPAAVGGACDTNPLSETTTSTCSVWFGRTLTAQECTAASSSGTATDYSNYLGVSFQEHAGCGFCVQPTVGQTCYATPAPTVAEVAAGADTADSCNSAELNACTLISAEALTYSGDGGLVTSQKETYSCQKESRQCLKWSPQDSNCLNTDLAQGTDKLSFNTSATDNSLNNAMASAATIDGTAKGLEGAQTSTSVPRVFTGTSLGCRRPVGGLGKLAHKNCCKADLERPTKGNIIQGGCGMDEVKLAAAKRSSYATFVGDYCSSKVRLGFKKVCIERTDSYCVFPGILPRLIQEQGRAQLATLTANSTNPEIQRAALNFNYYDTNKGLDSGSWTSLTSVNGVRVAAWQWPAYCSTPEIAAEKFFNDPSIKSCPGVVSSWIATCDMAVGCDALPDDPSQGALNWTLRTVDPLELATTAVSKFAVVKGACNTGTQACSYEISAWPVGIGGRAVVVKDIVWTLISTEQLVQGATGTPTPEQFQMVNMGDLMFKGYSVPAAKTGVTGLPAVVTMAFSTNGGQTWAPLQIPTTALKAAEMTLPNSDVTLTGSCDLTKNVCEFRATGTVTVSAKSWGSAETPDCTGFTPGQLAVLDFAKMDLSEWLSTVLDKTSKANTSTLTGQAAEQFAAFNSLYQNGEVKSSAPVSANFAKAVPSEGFGPFRATLSVSGYWPETTGDPLKDLDKVTQVLVDWGDCSPAPQSLAPVDPTLGVGFRGSVTYQAPDTYECLGSPQANVAHTIKITATTSKSGTQTKTLSVENAWSKYPGANSNNSNVGSTITGNVPHGTALPPTIAP